MYLAEQVNSIEEQLHTSCITSPHSLCVHMLHPFYNDSGSCANIPRLIQDATAKQSVLKHSKQNELCQQIPWSPAALGRALVVEGK